ncbi:excisionase family DNA-binding protein [Aquibacillus rhizosphaerae]|uniref:Excisionase family DNA-binding protein n=1 Tax=Aquibacillus rhizosphaerae TaxID=3051431 RepID=A0ABT7L670_9BACI|nr:excisionase family DNA-binding protein [Aquibacillus sp. LR5S19]MDL4840695.1 excisionase family DNA-binding protein [Aquibacillus sp. LR5S19]
MYLTVEETADYLNMEEKYLRKLITQGKVRAIYDGERYIINKDQFETHLEQMDKYKALMEEILNEPIPEDIDVKDED